MKFVIVAAILFFANVLMANECQNKALEAAKKVDGQGAGGSGKVTKGMLDPDGNKIGEMQAEIANGRAAAIKAVTGKDLTPEQATALLNDANAKRLLGDDYKYYLAEKSRIGGAAALKAEEAAKTAAEAAELKRKAEEETRARIEADKKRADAQAREDQRRKDEADTRQREKEALDRRQVASQNRYNDPKVTQYDSTFRTSPNNMTSTTARQNLENYADAGTPQLAQAVNGLRNAMQVIERKISNLEASLLKSKAEDVKKGIKEGDGVRSKQLQSMLNEAKSECHGLSSVAATAGLNGSSVRQDLYEFTSRVCR